MTTPAAPQQGARAPFYDDVQGGECELVVPPGGRVYPKAGEAKIGVAHPGCAAVADLAIDLDAFFCPACHRNGRVSGAWCRDVIEAVKPPEPMSPDLVRAVAIDPTLGGKLHDVHGGPGEDCWCGYVGHEPSWDWT